jgi:hypothetical protein
VNRSPKKLRRFAALLIVTAAVAIPCAGWAWDDGVDGGGTAGDTPAAVIGG